MDRNNHARDAQRRAISVYTKRPDRAQVLHRGLATVRDGLTCTYEQDGQRLTLDMPNAIGGSGVGPTPGYFGRAAISGCLAIGIKMTAAREGLHLDLVNVEIEQDWDNRGVLAMEGASPVPSETRITVVIASSEPEHKIEDMVSRTFANDPWYLAFRDAQKVSTAVSIGEGVT